MNYSPNHQLFSSVFVLPSAVADEHLKLASGAALKVILALFRSQNEPFDPQNLSQKTGLPVSEVLDQCAYWAQKGVLQGDTHPAVQAVTAKDSDPQADEVPTAIAEKTDEEPPYKDEKKKKPAQEVHYAPIDSIPYEPVSGTIYLMPQEGSSDDPNAPLMQTIIVERGRDQYIELFTGKELPEPESKPEETALEPKRKNHRDPITMEELSEMFDIPDINQPFVAGPVASAAIATAVNMTEAAMEVAMDATTKAIIAAETAEREKQEAKKKAREKITVSPSRPTHAQICKRLDECEELRILFNEAQAVLGRMMGTGDQAALLLLYDYYGLPADVLLMLCEYARTMGKAGNLNYIYAVGQDWSEREIDTFERADEELRRLARVDSNWSRLCELTGIQHPKPTKGQQKYLRTWIDEWKFSIPMIALAFEKMQERTDTVRFSYMNGILKNWRAKGITTPAQAAKEEQEFQEKMQTEKAEKKPFAKKQTAVSDGISAAAAKSGTAGTPASYDLDKAEQTARSTVPTLRKRGKK